MPLFMGNALSGWDTGTSSTSTIVQWAQQSPTSAMNAIYPQAIWNYWVGTENSVNTVTTATTWNTWLGGSISTTPYQQMAAQSQASAQQQTLMRQQHDQAVTAVKKREAAAARAKKLMRDNLTAIQREALEKHGWFLVEGGRSGKLYRVYGNRHAGNIFELNDKMKEVAQYCVHANDNIPLGDQLLAQALSLRFDEEHIIGRANRTALVA